MCDLGEFCPNWLGWTDEIGILIAFVDERIADLTEQCAKVYDEGSKNYLDREKLKELEGRLAAYEELRQRF